MAESIGLEVIFQLCATVVLILVIKKYTYKAYLEMMDKRTKTINDSITTAESNKVLSAKELEIVLKEKEEIKEFYRNNYERFEKNKIIIYNILKNTDDYLFFRNLI